MTTTTTRAPIITHAHPAPSTVIVGKPHPACTYVVADAPDLDTALRHVLAGHYRGRITGSRSYRAESGVYVVTVTDYGPNHNTPAALAPWQVTP